jgi:hypothetical protein
VSTGYRAGASVEDYCRVCKDLRDHRVIAVDAQGTILRVICGYCQSDHHFRGGRVPGERRSIASGSPRAGATATAAGADALVSDRELAYAASRERRSPDGAGDADRDADEVAVEPGLDELDGLEVDVAELEKMLRRVIREETGLTPVTPAEKWRGGELVLKPGKPGVQDKAMPIDTFFHKVVMLRNRLRVLEQKINASKLAEDEKLELQGYITGCYGSLTSFNVLFADEADKFKGSGGGD